MVIMNYEWGNGNYWVLRYSLGEMDSNLFQALLKEAMDWNPHSKAASVMDRLGFQRIFLHSLMRRRERYSAKPMPTVSLKRLLKWKWLMPAAVATSFRVRDFW